MKICMNQSGGFEPCPDYSGPAVCVDITPLQTIHSQYGDRDVFKVVFEIDQVREDGKRFAVWSRPFTPSLNDRANFRRFLRSWFGRDLTAQELEEFETEGLIGKPAQIVVVQEEAENGNVYSNIASIRPAKEGEEFKPSGEFTRKKDREDQDGVSNGSRYSRAEQSGGDVGREDWMKTKVHVGKHAGVELGDLDVDAVNALIQKWVPEFKKMEKPRAADKRLAAALEGAERALAEADDTGKQDSPY